ncbi:MAG: DUF1080 domain-containing protein [Tannerella sp.]|jgi:hypothetical protein|nr:DUF1080 domain-containing protein [Tannerella sp.]
MKTCFKKAIILLFLTYVISVTQAQAQQFPETETEEGFRMIFNGTNFDGWKYDPVYWSIENGVMVGEVTEATLLKNNSFIIWMKEQPADFELKMDFKVSAKGNSGINYRSSVFPDVPYALEGYQLDIDGEKRCIGQNYEERRRTFLALRGQVSQIENDGKPYVAGSTGSAEELGALIKAGDWNEAHVIAKGNTLIHLINGRVMSIVVDKDTINRSNQGYIGMQVHVGPPMKIQFRNIRLKEETE